MGGDGKFYCDEEDGEIPNLLYSSVPWTFASSSTSIVIISAAPRGKKESHATELPTEVAAATAAAFEGGT